MMDRRELLRPFRQRRQQRVLMKIQLFQRLAEIIFGRRLETISATAQENLVAIECEYLLLGVNALDLHGVQRLFEFARVGALAAQKEAPGKLLRQRRSAPRAPPTH